MIILIILLFFLLTYKFAYNIPSSISMRLVLCTLDVLRKLRSVYTSPAMTLTIDMTFRYSVIAPPPPPPYI